MNKIISKFEKKENRKDIFSKLYNLDKKTCEIIFSYSHKDRNALGERCAFAINFGIDCSIMRLLLDYNRYSETDLLVNYFKENFSDLRVLDYGSGAGDYGVIFSLLGSQVTFYDYPHMLKCPVYRCEQEGLKFKTIDVPKKLDFKEYNIVIFSEVLEHLENPLEELQNCLTSGVKYVFTTAYPFVPIESAYFNKSGHSETARNQTKECQDLLEKNYVRQSISEKHLFKLRDTCSI